MKTRCLPRTSVLALALSLFFCAGARAGPGTSRTGHVDAPRRESSAERDARLRWWRDARFGMFIHWGPVSLRGTEIGWSRGRQVPADEYDQLYKKFAPVRFDAEAWVSIAKAAGMKYVVITSKHHDGFCLWDSETTKYDIASTPFARDVLAELAEACRKQGLRFSTYYSICDWWHPDYPTGSPGGRTLKPSPNLPRYIAYMKRQLHELVEKYGPLGILWFDGEWEKPWTPELGKDLYRYVRDLQPNIIVNNRVGKGRSGMAGTTGAESLAPGDYDTPEQRVGAFNRERPWETCMTICRQWAWKPDDTMKPLRECMQTLLRTVGGDGNLLFNVGPMPDGRIEPRQAERLREMGRWLETYGSAVYGTRGGPFKPGRWGASTSTRDRIHLFVMRWPSEGPLRLPAIPRRIVSWQTCTPGEVRVVQSTDAITVSAPESARDAIATVIELTVDGRAVAIEPLSVSSFPSGSLAFGRPARASNVFQNQASYGPGMAVDDDPETRWATDAGTLSAWLEVDLGAPVKIGRVVIDERAWHRVRKFELRCRDGEVWKTVLSGTTIGEGFSSDFAPATARHVRLEILEATEGPTLWEFRVLPPSRARPR